MVSSHIKEITKSAATQASKTKGKAGLPTIPRNPSLERTVLSYATSTTIRQLSPQAHIDRDRLNSGYRTHARSGEKSTPGSRCALPHRGPTRRQPLLSGADQGIRTGSAKSIVLAHCRQQFFLAGWVVFCWDLRARLFWDFAASGTGRRRPDRHFDRMEAAE